MRQRRERSELPDPSPGVHALNLSLDDLALAGAAGHYRRMVGDGWTFADRVFGGYTAALALAGARRESPHPSVLSAHVVFLEAARPGLLELTVTALRGGRRTWAGRSVVSQDGRPVVTCDSWFGDRGTVSPAAPARADLGARTDPGSYPSRVLAGSFYG